VGVLLGVAVGVLVGISVPVGVGEYVGVSVATSVGVSDGVVVAVADEVGVEVFTGTLVAVAVAVGVSVASGPAPQVPKLPFCRLKSVVLTTRSPLKSALGSQLFKPGCEPKDARRMPKSEVFTQLSLLASPGRRVPISIMLLASLVSCALPLFASISAPLSHQL